MDEGQPIVEAGGPNQSSYGGTSSEARMDKFDPEMLRCFLDSKLPPMRKGTRSSTSTRKPAFFDTHLADSLRLKKIVFREGLAGELAKKCDSYLAEPSEAWTNDLDKLAPIEVHCQRVFPNERAVQTYLLSVANIFASVASGLIFKTDWLPILELDQEPAGHVQDEALADGFLYFADKQSIRGQLSESNLSDIELIEKYHLQNILTLEFKNLACGEALLAEDVVKKLAGEFHWKACMEKSSGDRRSWSCPRAEHRIGGRLLVTGRRTGPDSSDIADFLERSNALRYAGNDLSEGNDASSERATETPRKRGRPGNPQEHTRDMIQQLWASAVVQDSSFVLFGSGAVMYVGVRHREEQTLYVSSAMNPTCDSNPSYAKIQIGLYIAAYEDALNRARALDDMIKKRPKDLPVLYHLPIDIQLHTPKDEEDSKGDTDDDLQSELDKSMLDELKGFSEISLVLHNFTLAGKQGNDEVWTLTRLRSFRESTAALSSNKSTAEIHLDKQIPSARPYIVYLWIKDGQGSGLKRLSCPLVLKMSTTEKGARLLKDEYENYSDIGPADGLLQIFGLFSYLVNPRDKRCFLLMEYGGESLYQLLNHPTTQGRGRKKDVVAHSKNHAAKHRRSMASVHRKGYVLSSVTIHNILYHSKRKRVYFIGLKEARKPSKECLASEIRAEEEVLDYCLGLVVDDKVRRRARQPEGSRKARVEKAAHQSKACDTQALRPDSTVQRPTPFAFTVDVDN